MQCFRPAQSMTNKKKHGNKENKKILTAVAG